MIALDTNVLARHLAEDDLDQVRAARAVLGTLSEENPAFVSLTATVELYWVLHRVMRHPAPMVNEMFDALMRTPEIEIEDGESVGAALEQAKRGADFADALIDATSRLYGVIETVTFDKAAASRFGWRLLA